MDPESYDMETNFLVSLPGQPGIGDSPGAGANAGRRQKRIEFNWN